MTIIPATEANRSFYVHATPSREEAGQKRLRLEDSGTDFKFYVERSQIRPFLEAIVNELGADTVRGLLGGAE